MIILFNCFARKSKIWNRVDPNLTEAAQDKEKL